VSLPESALAGVLSTVTAAGREFAGTRACVPGAMRAEGLAYCPPGGVSATLDGAWLQCRVRGGGCAGQDLYGVPIRLSANRWSSSAASTPSASRLSSARRDAK
jgi:hypothetical protein